MYTVCTELDAIQPRTLSSQVSNKGMPNYTYNYSELRGTEGPVYVCVCVITYLLKLMSNRPAFPLQRIMSGWSRLRRHSLFRL